MRLGKKKVEKTPEVRSIEILKQIQKLVEEYREVINSAENDSAIMMKQAIVLGIWCPEAEVGCDAQIGHSMLCNGLLQRMTKDNKPSLPSFSELLKSL